MKDKKPIPTRAKQPKRGTQFYWPEKDLNVYLERVVDLENYFVSDDPNRSFKSNFHHVPAADLKQSINARTPISQAPKAISAAKKSLKDELNDFFAHMALKMPHRCMNCDEPLFAFNQFAKRCVSAHILPKSEFTSVATNELNIIFLGAAILCKCSCHDDWDGKGSDHRKRMAIYKVAIKRFDQFKHLLTQPELIKAYTYLGIKWQ